MPNVLDFNRSLSQTLPPSEYSVLLKSLWYDAKGDWKKAHDLVDQLPGKDAAWIHAYLHRKEGDLWNADYWYGRAGKLRPKQDLREEWDSLVQHFC